MLLPDIDILLAPHKDIKKSLVFGGSISTGIGSAVCRAHRLLLECECCRKHIVERALFIFFNVEGPALVEEGSRCFYR